MICIDKNRHDDDNHDNHYGCNVYHGRNGDANN